MNKLQKWEISVILGVIAMIVCCAATPSLTTHWWTTAFAPLCDALFTSELDGGDVVLRSKLWELLSRLWA
ncbi:MAG: hypothetical protein E7425_04905 [Ruminococcaceae bacterium]|nr:hypothetical protein [Oscillospiraceae bacterium]